MRDDACRMIYKLLQEYGVLTGEKAASARTTQFTAFGTVSEWLASCLSLPAHSHQPCDTHTAEIQRTPNRLDSSVTQPPKTASSEDNIRDLRELLVMLRMIWLDDVAINLQHKGLDQIGL